ncbi:hypothetical protein EBV26_12430 [bacterium]|nr:hypothetical protein [bacterium]
MGNWFSFIGQPNEEEVKMILNKILNEMMRRADLRDLYSLADPSQCSKYIVVGAKALDKLFTEMQLDIQKGEDGRIFFQKIDKIKKMTEFKDQQQQMCRLLAFFFVRIFRIYGALTLSIMDSELPMADPQDTRSGSHYTDTGVPYLRGFPQKTSWWGGTLQNKLTDDAGLYIILNDALTESSDGYLYFNNSPMRIRKNELLNDDNSTKVLTQGPFVEYFIKDDKYVTHPLTGRLVIERIVDSKKVNLTDVKIDGSNSNVTFTSVGFDSSKGPDAKQLHDILKQMFVSVFKKVHPPEFYPMSFLLENRIIDPISIEQKFTRLAGSNLYINYPDRYKQTSSIPVSYTTSVNIQTNENTTKKIQVSITINLYIEKKETATDGTTYTLKFDPIRATPTEYMDIMKGMRFENNTFTLQGSRIQNAKGRSIPEHLQRCLDKVVANDSDTFEKGMYSKDARGFLKAPTISGTDPFFNVTGLWKGLSKNPPVKAHCIARAVQLLNVAAIQDPNTGVAYSNVCNIKFPYITNNSLPTPGQTILTEDGIHALANLYIDNFSGNVLTPTNTEEFKTFRKKLKYLFGRFKTESEVTSIPDFKDITEENNPMNICQKGHTKLKIESGLVSRLRQKTYSLIQQQKTHIAQVMLILFKLFDEQSIRSGAGLEINDYVLSRGIEALNALAEEARGLLIHYYSNCEETYKDGLADIHHQIQSRPTSVTAV